jgi:adenosylhomocysteine nucleosidase
MQKTDIGLIAAMPEEIAPLLRRVGNYHREKAGRRNLYRFQAGPLSACLIESGMGPRNATEGASRLIETCSPQIILNFGFAGALSPGLKVGDIISADRLLFYHDGLFSEQQWLTSLQGPVGQQVKQGSFVTTSRITDKEFLAKRLPAGIRQAVVEMETAAVAKVAGTAGIPFMAIRAISDATDEELGFTLDEFCDHELNLKIWRVLLTVARKPWIIPQLIRLARNSKAAGSNLSSFLYHNLQKIVLP